MNYYYFFFFFAADFPLLILAPFLVAFALADFFMQGDSADKIARFNHKQRQPTKILPTDFRLICRAATKSVSYFASACTTLAPELDVVGGNSPIHGAPRFASYSRHGGGRDRDRKWRKDESERFRSQSYPWLSVE